MKPDPSAADSVLQRVLTRFASDCRSHGIQAGPRFSPNSFRPRCRDGLTAPAWQTNGATKRRPRTPWLVCSNSRRSPTNHSLCRSVTRSRHACFDASVAKPRSQNLLRCQFACRRRNVGMSSKSSLGRGGASRSLVSTRVDAGVSALGAGEGSAVGASGCRVSDAPAAAGASPAAGGTAVSFGFCARPVPVIRSIRPGNPERTEDVRPRSSSPTRRTARAFPCAAQGIALPSAWAG